MTKIIIAILLFPLLCMAQDKIAPEQRIYFEVPDYNGGINVQSDEGNLAINQSTELTNFIFSNYGSLTKRNGYQYWNAVALPSGDTVKDVHYFFNTTGSNQLLIATNNYIYASPFSDTITADSSWLDVRIGYDEGEVKLYEDQDTVWGDSTWWLLGIKVGDEIVINDSVFNIDSLLADTALIIDRNWTPASDSGLSYKVWRTIAGNPFLDSWNNKAYISDDASPPFIYDGDDCTWLSFIDSGTVDNVVYSSDSTFYIDTTELAIHTGQLFLNRYYLNFVKLNDFQGGDNTVWRELMDSLATGRHSYQVTHANVITRLPDPPPTITRYILWPYVNIWSGDTVELPGVIYLTDGVDPNFNDVPNPSTFRDSNFIIQDIEGSDTLVVSDASKEWFDKSFIEKPSYIGYYMVNGNDPTKIHTILLNEGNFLQILTDTSSGTPFAIDDRYYIYKWVPYDQDASYIASEGKSPLFKQTIFHKNILFASGFSLDKDSDTINTGFVYHSDIGLPQKFNSKITGEFGFDLSLNAEDRITAFFKLHDDLMISTSNRIYKLMGFPDALGDGALVEVDFGTGVNSKNSVVNRNNRESYLARKDGFYTFDGRDITKISLLIDPTIDNNRTSDFKLGYFDENIYFSFVDSNTTLVFHEPTRTFTQFDFGMSVFNNQATLVDSNYFLFSHPAIGSRRVYKYPTLVFSDQPDTLTSNAISFTYKTGWMNFGDIRFEKKFERFYVPVQKSTDTMTVRFRINYDSTTVLSIPMAEQACSGCDNRFIRSLRLGQTVDSPVLQIEVSGESITNQRLGKWGIKYYLSKDQ